MYLREKGGSEYMVVYDSRWMPCVARMYDICTLCKTNRLVTCVSQFIITMSEKARMSTITNHGAFTLHMQILKLYNQSKGVKGC